MSGDTKAAVQKYIQALHLYQDTLGDKHLYCASVLANLGVLYKEMAQREEKDKQRKEFLQLLVTQVFDNSFAMKVIFTSFFILFAQC